MNCVECERLGCPTEGMTVLCQSTDPICAAIVCAGHVGVHDRREHGGTGVTRPSLLRPQEGTVTEEQARRSWAALHRRPSYGYERGDCHCTDCGNHLELLRTYFGIQPNTHRDPQTRISNPAAAVRAAARERGWVG